MSRLGPTREWPPVNPLDALLKRDLPQRARPKVAIIAAHLCDIVAAAGGHLTRWKIVAIVHATKSAAAAGAARNLSGVAPSIIFCSLGFRPQETPAHLVHLTSDVAAVITQTHPDIILTQAYEGGDCDRDAVAFAVHHATRALARPPLIVEMTGWNAGSGMTTLGEFLHKPGVSERSSPLSAVEQAQKAAMLAAFPEMRSRVPVLDLHVEHFRMAPCYDFTRPPHSGPLLYEQAGSRWTGEKWRSQAESAVPELRVRSAKLAKSPNT